MQNKPLIGILTFSRGFFPLCLSKRDNQSIFENVDFTLEEKNDLIEQFK